MYLTPRPTSKPPFRHNRSRIGSPGGSSATISDRSSLVRRVYIVDDHPLVIEWLSTVIDRRPNLMVCGASQSTAAALADIEQLRPDLAVVEMNLRGGCAVSLIKEIKRQSPLTAVLVFSMHDEGFYAERALRAGAQGYVTKREPTERVMVAIDNILQGNLDFSSEFKINLVENLLRRNGADSDVSRLSDRELEIFRMMGEGRTTRGVSDDLGISIKTVQVYCGRMKRKLGVANAIQLVRHATLWWESQQQG